MQRNPTDGALIEAREWVAKYVLKNDISHLRGATLTYQDIDPFLDFALGLANLSARSGRVDAISAERHMRKAAIAGFSPAVKQIARMNRFGLAPADASTDDNYCNPTEALIWLIPLVNAKDAEAMTEYALILLDDIEGFGPDQDARRHTAIKLLSQAAELGHQEAVFQFGYYTFYELRDEEGGLYYLRQAAERKYQPAIEHILQMNEERIINVGDTAELQRQYNQILKDEKSMPPEASRWIASATGSLPLRYPPLPKSRLRRRPVE